MTDTLVSPETTTPPKRKMPRGGPRPGSGRPPKPHNPTLLEKAYAVLDEATLPAVQAVVDLLSCTDNRTRLEAAKLILAKTIPEQTPQSNTDGAPKRILFQVNVNGTPQVVAGHAA